MARHTALNNHRVDRETGHRDIQPQGRTRKLCYRAAKMRECNATDHVLQGKRRDKSSTRRNRNKTPWGMGPQAQKPRESLDHPHQKKGIYVQ